MTANAPPPICSFPARSRARCAASLRPARSPFPERAPMRLAVIRPITLQLVGSPARSPALAPDRRDTLHQRQQLRDVMAVRPRQTHRERDAPTLHQEVVLAAQFAPIYRAFPGLLTAVTGSHTGTVNHTPLPGELPRGLKFREDALPQPMPDAPRVPLAESAAAGMPRREVARRGEAFP